MPAFLVLVFVIVPLVELAIILQVGQLVGPWWTIAALVVFSIIGAALLRHEGRRAWQAFRSALEEGRWPGDEVTQGALVIVGGTLLLTPGFLTDALGFALLVPITRAGISRLVRARVTPGPVRWFGGGGRGRGRSGAARSATGERDAGRSDVLDVEVVEIEREGRPERDPRRDDDADDPPDDGSGSPPERSGG